MMSIILRAGHGIAVRAERLKNLTSKQAREIVRKLRAKTNKEEEIVINDYSEDAHDKGVLGEQIVEEFEFFKVYQKKSGEYYFTFSDPHDALMDIYQELYLLREHSRSVADSRETFRSMLLSYKRKLKEARAELGLPPWISHEEYTGLVSFGDI